ncbi:hypothetical protein ABE547_12010 [Dorea sp. YH-dor226]|uniref:hypothetical protein n=1 Tax=Dorea sp. YH-dor226 TaxID=3151119 RepID=UPI003243000C
MKKRSIFLTLAILICLLSACGRASSSGDSASSKQAKPLQSEEESTQTDILYAVFSAEDVKEYPIEYTGNKKTAEELAGELTGLTGLDFFITASKTDDGWIVDWAADSTLIAGLDDREQKEEFHFFDHDSLCWFMMDSLWRTLTENLNAENIYYTMDGGRELFFEELYSVNVFPSDIPYMGSEFYFAHADVRGDDEQDEQVCQPDAQSAYQGFWEYPDGTILEISNAGWWNTYMADEFTPFAGGPVEYDEEAVYLMNDDGSSGGGRAYFDENGNLIESGYVLTYLGLYR